MVGEAFFAGFLTVGFLAISMISVVEKGQLVDLQL
jgi:hypothetical protein